SVLPASARVEIVRELPGIRLSEPRFARGASVTGELMLPADQPPPKQIVGKLDGKAFPIDIAPAPPSAPPKPPGGGGFGGAKGIGTPQAFKDARLAARPFMFKTPPLPATAGLGGDQARLTMPIPGLQAEYGAVIPLEPTDFAIDFFPEGGDLVAGVQN